MVDTIKKAGFTVVELLVVVVVIGILATIVTVTFNGIQRNAADSAAKVSLDTASRKLDSYRLKNGLYDYSAALASYSGEADTTLSEQTPTTATTYCIKATNTKYSGLTYYANQKGAITTTPC